MGIDIDKLSEKELIELNHKIVARLRAMNEIRSHSEMMKFNIGERVSFKPDGRPEIIGIITKYNKKTVTIITESGEHWNVAPMFLKKINTKENTKQKSINAKIIEFKPT